MICFTIFVVKSLHSTISLNVSNFPQVYHYCHFDGRQDSFLCSNGTIFNQKVGRVSFYGKFYYFLCQVFTCDWWYNVNCAASEDLYNLNTNLYKVREYYNNMTMR